MPGSETRVAGRIAGGPPAPTGTEPAAPPDARANLVPPDAPAVRPALSVPPAQNSQNQRFLEQTQMRWFPAEQVSLSVHAAVAGSCGHAAIVGQFQ